MTQVTPLLTATDVVRILGDHGVSLTEETVRAWARTGRLPCVTLPSGRRFFRREDVEAILSGDMPAETAAVR